MAPPRKKQRLSNGALPAEAKTTSGKTEDLVEDAAEEQKPSTQDQHRRSLFVRSLPPSTTTASLTELFSDSYPIKHALAVVDPTNKQCRGYGFVTFADAEDAQRARAEFAGRILDGRKLRIEVAEPRHRDAENAPATNAVKEAKAKREEERTVEPPKLIVRNLPWTIKTSDQLAKLFLSYGKVKHADVPKKAGGLMFGFGFVTLRGRKNAEKALQGINGKEVDGRTLAVDWAVKKEVWNGTVDGEKIQVDNINKVHAEQLADEDAEDREAGPDEDVEGMSDVDDDDEEEDDANGIDSNEDEDMDEAEQDRNSDDRSSTLFVRNLPFNCTDEDLNDHFTQFGAVRYGRVVLDYNTGQPKGTGFVCFYKREDSESCLRGAPKQLIQRPTDAKSKVVPSKVAPHSVLQNEETDPSGRYTMDGRVLQVSRAVDKLEASRLTEEGLAQRNHRDRDKRRLYLLSEGTISTKSSLYEKLSPSERTMREASAKQRKTLIESNPSLHLSLTRLSVRNIPRSVTSKELKALAREAVVGFATDVKAGTRQHLSKEELLRGGEEMQAAEKERKAAGKGIVKQAKVVFEGREGSKVTEDSGAGRSRGYGFIEYYTHRSALMGLRWMNGHAIGYRVEEKKKGSVSREDVQERKKRLIAEFAIENAQVVGRRKDREVKAKDRAKTGDQDADADVDSDKPGNDSRKPGKTGGTPNGKTGNREGPASRKRKRSTDAGGRPKEADASKKPGKRPVDEKLAKRQQIIARKRALRRTRTKGGKA